MFRLLKEIRIGRLPLVLLAVVSGIATAVILSGGGDQTSAQIAAMAALRSGVITVGRTSTGARSSTPASGPASNAAASSGSGGGASSSGSSAGSAAGTGTGGDTTDDTSTGSDDDTTSTSTGTTTSTTSTTTTPTDAGLPKVGHVFLIALSTPSEADAFGKTSRAPYLRTLTKRGTLLAGFHSLGRAELPDLLAMVSGQAPNASTEGNCRRYVPFPASAAADAKGIVAGHGCVYPETALTIADQVTSAGDEWGAYVADSGSANCPVPNTNAALSTPVGDAGYDLLHNPFAFFGSLLDAGACDTSDQDLTALPKALKRASRTPAFTYLGADACADGDPVMARGQAATTSTSTTTTSTTGTTTAATTTPTGTTTTPTTTTGTTTTPASTATTAGCPAGSTAGIAAENAFLQTWVPTILKSAAYRKNGVLVIAFTGDGGRKGADTGALVLSRWTKHGKRLKGSYGPYSLLHSMEDMLNLSPLAHAANAPAFAKAVI